MPVLPRGHGRRLLIALDGAWGEAQASRIAPLVLGTCLEARPVYSLVAQCHDAFRAFGFAVAHRASHFA